jgi:GDP-L-fucose synthase
MNKTLKIYIAGHSGMVGSAIWRALEAKGYGNLIGITSEELGWEPEYDFNYLVNDMMASDLELLKK